LSISCNFRFYSHRKFGNTWEQLLGDLVLGAQISNENLPEKIGRSGRIWATHLLVILPVICAEGMPRQMRVRGEGSI
jgi:hypothetical protein